LGKEKNGQNELSIAHTPLVGEILCQGKARWVGFVSRLEVVQKVGGPLKVLGKSTPSFSTGLLNWGGKDIKMANGKREKKRIGGGGQQSKLPSSTSSDNKPWGTKEHNFGLSITSWFEPPAGVEEEEKSGGKKPT